MQIIQWMCLAENCERKKVSFSIQQKKRAWEEIVTEAGEKADTI